MPDPTAAEIAALREAKAAQDAGGPGITTEYIRYLNLAWEFAPRLADLCDRQAAELERQGKLLREAATELVACKQLASDGAGEWASRSNKDVDDANVYSARINGRHARIDATLTKINAVLEKPR